ncbi:hypothetical protein EZJ49_11990 [Bdellovibrio bacteriovorus]|uniref:hypothetical protein n=1 Tax=Bdellovibrio bacteriovorus TaxID=959 RepID=UPI0021D316AB|nr:hypothetical protein [Bdellovibrio bacteriovorus]UXR63785.1 hypothetical protein EZJ49_11990 [Bdellovibrio bacteriovorus]
MQLSVLTETSEIAPQSSIEKIYAETSFFFLLVLTLPALSASTGSILEFFFKIQPLPNIFPASIIASVGLTVFAFKTPWYRICVYLSFLIAFLLVSYLNFDLSWDGLAYHQRAIQHMVENKNLLLSSSGSIWADYYPKATWYFAAEVYRSLGDIQPGKIYHWLAALFIFSYSLRFSSKITHYKWAQYFFASIIAFNPISISQMETFYLDSTLGVFTFAIIFSVTLIIKEDNRFDWLILIISSTIAINLKFSGFAPPFLGFSFLTAYTLLKRNFTLFNKCLLAGLIALFIALGTLGFDPYIKNLLHGKHLLHPLYGQGKVDIMALNSPPGFTTRNRFTNLGVSILSKSENISELSGKTPQLKVPGTVFRSELLGFEIPDVRLAGWGVLFSLALISSFFAVNYRTLGIVLSTPLILIVLLTVVHPESWWARYSPQLIALPTLLALYSSTIYAPSRRRKYLGIFIFLVLILNSLLVIPNKYHATSVGNDFIKNSLVGYKGNHEVYELRGFIATPLLKRFNISPHLVSKEELEKDIGSFKKVQDFFYIK